MKQLKKIAIIATTAAVAIVNAWTTSFAENDKKLLIWINGDKGYNGLSKVGERFTKETGIKVQVEHPDKLTDKFMQAAAARKGPDIVFWAHDRLGEWAQSGLVIPVKPSKAIKDDVIDMGWSAFSHNGEIWGYPIALEAVGLIYNKKLVKTPPKTFEEIAKLKGKLGKGVTPIMWAYNTPYFSWPVLAAGGAEAYVRKDDKYDTKKTGVASESAITGAKLINSLISSEVMPKGVTYSVMDAAISSGKTAMVINGPWSWANLKKNGIDYAVAPLPKLNGKSAKPFVGVLGAMISSASTQPDIAKEFIENYLMKPEGLETVDSDVAIGVPASKKYYEKLKGKSDIAATMANVLIGTPMPNIPEMAKFWSALEAALGNITSGRQSPEEALKAAEKRILAN